VAKVKNSHPVYDTPVTVDPHTTVGETLSLLPKRAHGIAVVVEAGRPLGTVSDADATGVDRFAQAHDVMSSDLLTVPAGTSPHDIFDSLTRRHLSAALVLDDDRLVGVMTLKHCAALDPLPAGGRCRGSAADRRGGRHQR
jgi:IMP dehydrogenase